MNELDDWAYLCRKRTRTENWKNFSCKDNEKVRGRVKSVCGKGKGFIEGKKNKISKIIHCGGWFTVEGEGNNVVGSGGIVGHVGDADQVMMGYRRCGGSGGGGAAATVPSAVGGGSATSGVDVLGGSTGDYSPQGTPNSLGGHPTSGNVDAAGPYGPTTGGLTTYSPQDSPASSAGGNAAGNGHLPSFGFTQEQVACVCEVSLYFLSFVIFVSDNTAKQKKRSRTFSETIVSLCILRR